MTDPKVASLKSSRTRTPNASVKAQGQEAIGLVIGAQNTARGTCPGLNQRITEVQPW